MKKGDKVSVTDEALRGTVTSVNGRKVTFADEHGFTHTYDRDELVLLNHSLYENIMAKPKPETQKKISKKHSRKAIILDLHFEKLVPDPLAYEGYERLLIQKQNITEMLDYCRKNNLKTLEIVHGIGDGTLQKMVYKVLKAQTGLDFHNKDILHDQSGAVIVHLK